MRYLRTLVPFVAITGCFFCGSRVLGAVVAHTDFEAPVFTAGPLGGQNGWTTTGGEAVTVSSLRPRTGSQAILINGSGLVHSANYPDVLVGADAVRALNLTPVASGTPIITLQTAVRLDGPDTNTGGGINDDLISANLAVFDENGGYITEMLLSSNGNVYASAWDHPYGLGAPVTPGQYHTMAARLNYLTRSMDYFVDGQMLGTLPFGEQVQSQGLLGPALMVFAFDDPIINPGLYTASFDDVSVSADVPEPAGLAAVGLLSLALIRRRRAD
jgi:MYXO-CTERM domain-containing protein